MRTFFYFIEYLIVKLFFFIFVIFGYKISSNLGYIIGRHFGPIFRSKKLIIENLKKADISLKQNYETAASEVLGNYGRIFAEYPFIKRFRNGNLDKFIEIINKLFLYQVILIISNLWQCKLRSLVLIYQQFIDLLIITLSIKLWKR